ncbi:glycosyltransferase family 4 protein [Bacillus sp. D386]|uniref:glycosyltransferase family 4 protein n=1 Tax=Bacillus sp. D386 TaxID=2587155 RepID=UPI00111EB139|nr:MraY family glycosyltransferase [Bacillus sp. D386]
MLIAAFLVAICLTILITPFVIKLAHKIGATDAPNNRKVHKKVMPSMGGLAIFLSFIITLPIFSPEIARSDTFSAMFLGAAVILILGIFDDKYELNAKVKLIGQIAAALIIVIVGDIQVNYINTPFGETIEFGFMAIPITVIWIVGITNAINLIDGLDGLAAGVSTIALLTISAMAVFRIGDIFVAMIALILAGSTLGFLKFNFFPAKIFMGDTGAMFLGFMISVLSLLGFKNITVISLIIPIIILGVPISDTFFAMVRRFLQKKPLHAPDKSHLHHCLLRLGYSHRTTVLMIYAMAAVFGLAAFIFSMATLWGGIFFSFILLIALELMVERIGLLGENHKPLHKLLALRSADSKERF